MPDYIILDKTQTNLPMLIYLGKDKTFFPYIMFQNDYENNPNTDNLIKMNIDGSIVAGDIKINIKQDDINKLISLFEENERKIVSYWYGDITKEEFLDKKYDMFKYTKYFYDTRHFPFTRPVFRDLYKQIKKQKDDIYVGNQYEDKYVFDYIHRHCEKFVDNKNHVKIIKKYKPQNIVDLSILVERLCISDAFDTENQAEEKMLLQKLLEKRLEETHGFIAYTQQLYYVINLICEEDNEDTDDLFEFSYNFSYLSIKPSKFEIFKKIFYSKCKEKQLTKQEIDKLWKICFDSYNLPVFTSSGAIEYAKNIYRIAYLYKYYCKK